MYDNVSTPEEREAWKRTSLPRILRLMNRGCLLIAEAECVLHHQARPPRSWQDLRRTPYSYIRRKRFGREVFAYL